MILLTDEQIKRVCAPMVMINPQAVAKAQLRKDADTIDSMVADGWYLEDIVKAMRKEAE